VTKNLKKIFGIALIIILISSIQVFAESEGVIEKINKLYKIKQQINIDIEQKEAKILRISEMKEKIEKGICTREDIVFSTENRKEMLERYSEELENLSAKISEMESQLVYTDNMIDIYTKIYNSESKTVVGLIGQYVSTSKKMGSGVEFVKPLKSYSVTSTYGNRNHPIFNKVIHHNGIDLGAPEGTPIYSAEDGIVIKVAKDDGYGNNIIVMHRGGYFTLYAHIRDGGILVKTGESVKKGQKIAEVGNTGLSTGYHLHFEIFKGTSRVNPESMIKFR